MPRLALESPKAPPAAASLPLRVRLKVDGMVCSSCTAAVRTCLINLPGVVEASVSLATNMAVVKY